MPLLIASQSELIPGYRLLERLGQGGFGEVWKAEAPGGLLKAIKIIHGLSSSNLDSTQLNQELKALQRVKNIRHPYILSLERFDIIDGRLIIVSELAECTLFDRFQECCAQGLPGIPRQELLRYLDEAAEALDLMNARFNLQHLDIKPQNLFLLFNHCKVGDFGLVKDLEGMFAQMSSGVTPIYAAPETFEGKVSRFSDQYNLAITFQELLTGERPYDGATGRQLMLQHIMGVPNLGPLPPADNRWSGEHCRRNRRSAYPSCLDEVRAAASPMHPRDGKKRRPTRRRCRPSLTVQPRRSPRRRSSAWHDACQARTVWPRLGPGAARSLLLFPHPRAIPPAEKPADLCVRPRAAPAPAGTARDDGGRGFGAGLCDGPGRVRARGLAAVPQVAQRRPRPERILAAPDSPAPPSIRTPRARAHPPDVPGLSTVARRDPGDSVPALLRPTTWRRQRQREELERWLPLNQLTKVPRGRASFPAVGGTRSGRLAFVSCADAIATSPAARVGGRAVKKNPCKTRSPHRLGLRSPRGHAPTWSPAPTGGTGSGMFLEMASALRQELQQLGHPHAKVIGLFLVPAVKQTGVSSGASPTATRPWPS